jgi:hypothetical protein
MPTNQPALTCFVGLLRDCTDFWRWFFVIQREKSINNGELK